MDEHTFDYADFVNALRCHTTPWLRDRREWLVRQQRRLRVEELAVTRVLDDRGALDDSLAAADGVSLRTARETIETARALENLPEIAGVAAAGGLSHDQLAAVVRVADPHSDAEWARRAPSTAPADLLQEARTKVTPTAQEGLRRRAARELGFWWEKDQGMLAGRFRLPDLDGARFENVINHMVDRMGPPKGQPWETRARRGADALVELVRNYAGAGAVSGPTPLLAVQIPPVGPATIAGIPLPDEMVESLRTRATVEPTLIDDDGTPVAIGRVAPALSRRVVEAVLRRDGRCRWPGCDRRTGLEVHHLWPRSWGGTDEQSNLAAVCTGGGTDHHPQLAPHGPHLLLGNPNRPDGLRLVHRDDLARDPAQARAGPTAA
jgi:hypothetical protein